MSEISLEPLIKQFCNIRPTASSKGWHTCKCKVCNDYKVRGGFAFENDTTTYHCFNCGIVAKHNPNEYYSISENMLKVLEAFAVPESEYNQLIINAMAIILDKPSVASKKIIVDPDIELYEIKLPEYFVPLSEASGSWAQLAKMYLQLERMIDPDEYPFYILSDSKQDDNTEKKWRGRLIIPYYRQNKCIWYQGRDLRPTSKMRYMNAESPSECILSNCDSITEYQSSPLYVCEGFFDSHMINGIAIFGNTLKLGQIKLLNQSSRQKIYIPDKFGDGHLAANKAIELGWKVAIPDVGSCKDINEAVRKYGKLYVKKTIQDNVYEGDAARVMISNLRYL